MCWRKRIVEAAPSLLPLLLGTIISMPLSQALEISTIGSCVNPLGGENGPSMGQGVAIKTSAAEFYASFARIFRLSDGSSISLPAQERMESLQYIQDMLYSVGVYVNRSATSSSDGDILQICGTDVLNVLLLAAVGNFVASPGDPNISPQSSMKSMPSVVIDAYTGQLVMHTPYDAVRGYFVEALLVISIIVISRLTFVRNNVYTSNFTVSLPAPNNSNPLLLQQATAKGM